jgi:redox-sensitive bicupin YhaK (pirin superfamily)
MSIRIIPKSNQAYGAFNSGQIIENKPIGFPQDGGFVRPYSNLFYWARAEAVIDSTIGLHPHKGFEIMSFVINGRIRHFDTKMNQWKELEAGDAQIIRAGSGIQHAEHMEKGAVMFQIWLDPDLNRTFGQEASYNDYSPGDFKVEKQDQVVIRTFIGEGSKFQLDSKGIEIKEYLIDNSQFSLETSPNNIHSFYVLEGSGKVNGESINTDDFIIMENMEAIRFQPDNNGLRVFEIRSPGKIEYKTYAEIMQEGSRYA